MQRQILKILKSIPTIEGAGVRLKRAFGSNEAPLFDPFLLLDDFHSNNPEDYKAGFPWHPHRGIETVTYMLDGRIEHRDSMGNKGVIGSGDVQWMTAGSGIIHSEMPEQERGMFWGFQLWINLPSGLKMASPKYRDIAHKEIPEVTQKNGVKIKIICGRLGDITGPARDIAAEPEYLDVTIPAGEVFGHNVPERNSVLVYILDGKGFFDSRKGRITEKEHLLLYNFGDSLSITALDSPIRLLLISGKPIGEPVAWYGPIVMNTQEELNLAFKEYREGTFLKHK